VLGSSEEETLSDGGIEEDIFFLFGEFEDILEDVDGGGRLLEEELDRGVGDDGFTMRTIHEVLDILGDGCDPETVFTSPFDESEEEFGTVLVLHDIPGFIDDEDAFAEGTACDIPDVPEEHVHGNRAENIVEVSNREDDKSFGEIDIGRMGEDSGEDTGDVFFEAFAESFGSVHGFENRVEIAHNRDFFTGDIIIREGNPLEGIGRDDGFFEDGRLGWSALAEHEIHESDEIDDRTSEEISRFGFGIFEASWEVERIDSFVGVEINVDIRATDGVDECLVFVFGIEDDDVGSEHKGAEYLEFDREGLSSTGFGENDHIGILCAESVEVDERIIVCANPIKDSVIL